VHQRKLDPYGIVVRHREWYVVGWDHLRKAVRTFLLPRIQEADDTEERFRVKDGFDLDHYLKTAVDGHQSTGPLHRVKLRFAKEAAALAEEFIWNGMQKVTKDRQGRGRVVMEFETAALYAVERKVLGWGGKVEVLEPPEIYEQVRMKAHLLEQIHRRTNDKSSEREL
jgi:predicted DNA-binding transcriptional regulator YafY